MTAKQIVDNVRKALKQKGGEMNTTGDILGSWKNNMDAEEKKLYEDLKNAFAKLTLSWTEQHELDFASITNTADRKELMLDYLRRIEKRLNSPASPRPENYQN